MHQLTTLGWVLMVLWGLSAFAMICLTNQERTPRYYEPWYVAIVVAWTAVEMWAILYFGFTK